MKYFMPWIMQHAPRREEEIREAVPIAQKLMAKLKLNNEMTNPDNPDAWEKATLLLPIAKRWQSATTIAERKIAVRQLAALYTQNERNYLLVESRDINHVLPFNVLEELIRQAWPDSNGDFEWIKANVTKDSVVIFPYSSTNPDESMRPRNILNRIYEKLDTPEHQRFMIGGVASRALGLAFLWEDSTQDSRIHEGRHVKFPGLLIGALGSSLNEGFTEWGTIEALGERPILINQFDLVSNYTYSEEVIFIQKLALRYPSVKRLLEQRYHNDSFARRQATAGGIIDALGLEDYLNLYLMRPHARSLGEANKVGYVDPRDLENSLLNPTSG